MKIIQNPRLRRGLYAEDVSVVCVHIEAIRSPLFLRLGAEKEQAMIGGKWGMAKLLFGTANGEARARKRAGRLRCQLGGKSCVSWESQTKEKVKKVLKMSGTVWLGTYNKAWEERDFLRREMRTFWISRQRENGGFNFAYGKWICKNGKQDSSSAHPI